MPIQIQGAGGVVAEVDASQRLQTLATIGDKDGNPILVTEDDYLLISPDALLFYEQVDGSAVNLVKWAQALTGAQTIVQGSGFIVLNNSALTTLGTASQIQSIKQFPLYGTKPLRVQINAKTNVGAQANATMELGLGLTSGVAAPTDGAFFRWANDGTFRAVINRGGTETMSAALVAPPLADSTLFEIVVVEDLCQFFVDDALVASVSTPATAAYPVDLGHQPVFARTYNGGSAPGTAPQISIGQVVVLQQSININKLWKETLVSLGQGAYQAPVTPFLHTANFANSAAPASATLSNTAAGYATLGGKFQFAAVAGAETDYALFAYQVPAGYQLYVTSIAFSVMNMVVAVATTPTTFEWGAAVNGSAVTLLTAADAAGVWAPRRIQLGHQSIPIAAPPGAIADDLIRTFDPPLIVDSGRFFHVILRMPVATATATEIFRGGVTVTGYFE